MIQLGEHFKTDDRSRHSDWLRQQRWFIKAKHEQVRRDEIEDRAEQNVLSLAVDVAIATEIQIEKFKTKLDTYDEATVIALMENQQVLDMLYAKRVSLLEQAFVLADGRRVFKSEDGTKVFDESGVLLSPEIIAPDDIPDHHPKAETFFANEAAILEAEQERTRILEFQEKVDAARERVAEGDISKPDLDELDAELADAMPQSVKTHVPGFDTADNVPAAKTEFTATANPVATGNPVNRTSDPHLQL